MMVGAIRRPPETVAQWGTGLPRSRPVVVYCEIGRDTAASLRGIGLDARFLENGIAGCHDRLPRSRLIAPLLAGSLGGLLAIWITFVPCFLWIELGAPFIERLRENKLLSGALACITAAVVGVILNLAIWFGLHAIFGETVPVHGFGLAFDMPVLASINPWAFVLSLAAIVAIFRFKAGTIHSLAACSVAGILLYLSGLATS